MPLFFGTDYDVKLEVSLPIHGFRCGLKSREPIPGCVTKDNPAKYEVVTAGDYVKSRLEATYAHSKGDSSA